MDASFDFAELLHAARDGDHDALATLLDKHRNYLLLIANAKIDDRIRGKVGSSDIVQESLITAQQNFAKFEGDQPEQLKAWLKQILTNDVYEAGRRFRHTAKRQVEREQPLQYGSSIQNPLVDHANTPRTNALQTEEAKTLERAMSQLPEHFQLVIRLRGWDQLSFKQVGQEMGRSEEAARKLWTRAIVRLQELLPDD